MKKAIIFDLYDTLITIEKKNNPYLYLLSTLSNDKFEHKGIINSVITDNYDTDELILYFELNMEADKFNAMLDDEMSSVVPVKGLYTVLTKLKEKYRLFLLSNLSVPYKKPFYDLNLNFYFEKAFFSCDERNRKPNPTFFEKVLNYSKLEKSDLIMIGDSLFSDIQGARDFGIDAIYKGKDDLLEDVVRPLL